jgi:hypothetical protein
MMGRWIFALVFVRDIFEMNRRAVEIVIFTRIFPYVAI